MYAVLRSLALLTILAFVLHPSKQVLLWLYGLFNVTLRSPLYQTRTVNTIHGYIPVIYCYYWPPASPTPKQIGAGNSQQQRSAFSRNGPAGCDVQP